MNFNCNINIIFLKYKYLMGIGDWGLGVGEWGLGIGTWALGRLANSQVAEGKARSPIPTPPIHN